MTTKPCKPHPGKLDDLGYGHVCVKIGNKTETRAHRVVFWRKHGYLPVVVRHTCDNRWCVEESHLVGGTQADNLQDMHDRGRALPSQRGVGAKDLHPNAKITSQDVAAIRADTRSQRDIAKAYGISQRQVGRIKRHERW